MQPHILYLIVNRHFVTFWALTWMLVVQRAKMFSPLLAQRWKVSGKIAQHREKLRFRFIWSCSFDCKNWVLVNCFAGSRTINKCLINYQVSMKHWTKWVKNTFMGLFYCKKLMCMKFLCNSIRLKQALTSLRFFLLALYAPINLVAYLHRSPFLATDRPRRSLMQLADHQVRIIGSAWQGAFHGP